MGIDDIRADFERRRPGESPEATWSDGDGPSRRISPRTAVAVVLGLLVVVAVVVFVANPGSNSDDDAAADQVPSTALTSSTV